MLERRKGPERCGTSCLLCGGISIVPVVGLKRLIATKSRDQCLSKKESEKTLYTAGVITEMRSLTWYSISGSWDREDVLLGAKRFTGFGLGAPRKRRVGSWEVCLWGTLQCASYTSYAQHSSVLQAVSLHLWGLVRQRCLAPVRYPITSQLLNRT